MPNREDDSALIFNANSPVEADGDEVEDGRGRADDVEGDVRVAHDLREAPHAPIDLKKKA